MQFFQNAGARKTLHERNKVAGPDLPPLSVEEWKDVDVEKRAISGREQLTPQLIDEVSKLLYCTFPMMSGTITVLSLIHI